MIAYKEISHCFEQVIYGWCRVLFYYMLFYLSYPSFYHIIGLSMIWLCEFVFYFHLLACHVKGVISRVFAFLVPYPSVCKFLLIILKTIVFQMCINIKQHCFKNKTAGKESFFLDNIIHTTS